MILKYVSKSFMAGGTWLCFMLLTCSSCAPKHVMVRKQQEQPITPSKDDWTRTLPVPPGESLKEKKVDNKEKQVITLFELNDMRFVSGSVFITGKGYAEINGGGKFFAGANRGLDPYLELTITSPDSPVFRECKEILDKEHLVQNAIAISGHGYFKSNPGIGDRALGIFRLDTVSECKLVPRQ